MIYNTITEDYLQQLFLFIHLFIYLCNKLLLFNQAILDLKSLMCCEMRKSTNMSNVHI